MATARTETTTPSRDVNPNQLLYSLMIPAIIMPLSGWMFSVSLPIIRDDFSIAADLAAWIATAFTLPFMILMPVYGRISDGLGKRRLLLIGITIFAIGSLIATLSTNLTVLMLGRVIQGLGAAGLVPLSLALISEVFPAHRRGKAMGLWSTVGPVTGVIGPILAGYIVAAWGWRAAFIPAMLFALISLFVVYFMIPTSVRQMQFNFLTTFDWIGVGLLAATLTFLLFYLSSRPITGRPPLQDWRLFMLMTLSLAAFLRHENKKAHPFINLRILKNRSLVIGSLCACLRMLMLSGNISFIMPLYLADIVLLNPTRSGFFLMTMPAAMVGMVRFGGSLSDRLGSRIIAMTGFSIITAVTFTFSRLPDNSPLWLLITLLIIFGTGAGLMLAALHRAALNDMPEADLGTSSGIYSMIRFLGSASGAAFGGILLQFYLDQESVNLLAAYQHVFQWFAGFALLGVMTATFLPKTESV
jgi:EmrB/QacA subfamily drug resistance transporter